MKQDTAKAILVVSFGTSYAETRKVTIDAIEQDIAAAFPAYRIYRAWTSRRIIARLKERDHFLIDNVQEAMERMAADGITDVIVQPTHVINGFENDAMKEDVLSRKGLFHSVTFGTPLLTNEADRRAVISAVAEEFSNLSKKDALVLMGHGTAHEINSVYETLDQLFKTMGYSNIFLGTVEASPSMEHLISAVRTCQPCRVVMTPFMIVAGDHARNDMAGDKEDSWVHCFQREGFSVEPVLKGLGEYQSIRKLFIAHVQQAIDSENPTAAL